MSEEVRFFRRLSIYAVIIGAIYWFVSYEWVGTTLLVVFGLGAGATTLLLASGQRPTAARAAGEADGPFGDESGRVPSATLAPFLVGLAVALVALGLVFGPWFILVAVIPLVMGAHAWLAAARAELDATEHESARGPEPAPAGTRGSPGR